MDHDVDIGITIEYIDSIEQKNCNDNNSSLDDNDVNNSCHVEGNNAEGDNQ